MIGYLLSEGPTRVAPGEQVVFRSIDTACVFAPVLMGQDVHIYTVSYDWISTHHPWDIGNNVKIGKQVEYAPTVVGEPIIRLLHGEGTVEDRLLKIGFVCTDSTENLTDSELAPGTIVFRSPVALGLFGPYTGKQVWNVSYRLRKTYWGYDTAEGGKYLSPNIFPTMVIEGSPLLLLANSPGNSVEEHVTA